MRYLTGYAFNTRHIFTICLKESHEKWFTRERGAVAGSVVRMKTLIHEVVGSSLVSGVSAPQRVGCWIAHMKPVA